MNSYTYRTIFNRARGCLIAVAETAKSSGKASGESSKQKRYACPQARARKAYNSALSRSNNVCYAPSQIGTDPVAPLLAFGGMSLTDGVGPYLFVASRNTSAGSVLKAGGDINIAATNGSITAQGANIAANNNVSLSATDNVNLLASMDTESSRSKNSSSSTSVGVSIGIGGQSTGLSLDISAMRGRGQANSDSTIYNSTNVTAGNVLNIQSGGNTNLIGAVVSGNTTNVNVGGNLTIQSLQDVATSSASQSTTGVSVSIPIYGTGGSASVSQTRQNSNSNYQSVNQQSGISAGDGGFNITVGGNTNLVGATISSTANASAAGNNSLTTATLTTSDIQNQATASASSSGTSIGTNMLSGNYGLAKGVVGNLMNRGSASTSDSSTTTSAISGATVTVGNTTTNTAAGQALTSTNGVVVSSNTTSTNRVLAKADVAGLQAAAQQNQANNNLLVTTLSAFTDAAYKAMFQQGGKLYSLPPGCSNSTCAVEVSPEDAAKLQASGADGKVHVATNGIYNGLDDAIRLSQQNSGNVSSNGSIDYGDKPTTQYLVYAPQASNAISELLVAGYQNAGSPGGLTNAEQTVVNIIQQTSAQGQQLDLTGHSRGSLTIDNAINAVVQSNGNGSATGVTVNYIGGAANAQQSGTTLQQMTGNASATVNSVVHPQDTVGVLVGGNNGTATVQSGNQQITAVTDDSSPISNAPNVMFGNQTPHNCYGSSGGVLGCDQYWNGAPTTKPYTGATHDPLANPSLIPVNNQGQLLQQQLQQQVQQQSNSQTNSLIQSVQPQLPTQTLPNAPNQPTDNRTQQIQQYLNKP